jgi:AcrR family transcriptional regulator
MGMGTPASTTRAARGGRGARERILQAAEELFYTRGIHATGVAALMEAAHVSPRTFYVHFPTKNALVEEYLRRFESEKPLAAEAALERGDQTAAQRLLAIFAPPESNPPAPLRAAPSTTPSSRAPESSRKSPVSRSGTSLPSAIASWPLPRTPEQPTRRASAGNSR